MWKIYFKTNGVIAALMISLLLAVLNMQGIIQTSFLVVMAPIVLLVILGILMNFLVAAIQRTFRL
jgi:hypothetical protein